MKKTLAAIATFLGVSLLTIGAACAIPFAYSEGTSGDLRSTLPASSVFAFGTGDNQITGNTSVNQAGALDLDSFAFSIPTGTALASATLQLNGLGFNGPVGVFKQILDSFELCSGNSSPCSPLAFDIVDFINGPTNSAMFTGALPRGAGIYGVNDVGVTLFNLTAFTADYTWHFNVTALPEPSTISLLAVVLGTLAAPWGRRRPASGSREE